MNAVNTMISKPSGNRDGHEPLKGRDMLCFSHDWSGDPLSKTHLMRLLARDNRILWVNSIGYRTPAVSKRDLSRALSKLKAAASPLTQVERNIFVLNPLAIPLYGALGQRANRWLLRNQVLRAMRRLGFRRPVNWVFNPAAAVIARQLGEELLIYYCVDELTHDDIARILGCSRRQVGKLLEQLSEWGRAQEKVR